MVWLHLLLLPTHAQLDLELELEPVVVDQEAMELVKIQAIVVHNGVIVELEMSTAERHRDQT